MRKEKRSSSIDKTHLSSILENQLTSTSRQINKLEGPLIIIKNTPNAFSRESIQLRNERR